MGWGAGRAWGGGAGGVVAGVRGRSPVTAGMSPITEKKRITNIAREMAVLQNLQQLLQELDFSKLSEYPFLVSLFLIPVLLWFTHSKLSSGQIKHLPPSPTKLPFLGHLHLLGTHPHRSLRALSESLDAIFSNRPRTTANDILTYGRKDVGFAPYDEYWKQARKICVFELLSLRRVQQFQSLREEETAYLVDRIHKASETSGATCSINLTEFLIETTNNILSRCAVGQTFGEKDGWGKFGGLLRVVTVQLMALCVGDFFPYLKWIDHLRGFIGSLKATFRALNRCFDLLIDERKAILQSDGERNSEKKNFVDILLQLEKDAKLSPDEIKGIILDMFLAGTTTTSGTLEWMMTELLRNPNVMKKAQEEVRKVVGKRRKIDMNDINQMGYLKCVIKETLRLYPPAPLLVRETTKTIEIKGYRIPSKTRVLCNAWAIQRHPSSWDRPEDFFPERFENNLTGFEGEDFNLTPFGVGRRSCPGSKFAIASIEYIAANLVYWFDWKLPSGHGAFHEELDMNEVYGLTVHRKVPCILYQHLTPLETRYRGITLETVGCSFSKRPPSGVYT
ncbi:hypothetical protein TIFTF001_027709 [Ficus carica]|uniref:Cytochrome P450 n=1 Tax=Ficus carica TaxID=3494 RepID=A0AA88J0K6_FICCA|nr:hypothetical protein TIFTF001_027709 [Ficus carica]